jgi:hypothetical protein
VLRILESGRHNRSVGATLLASEGAVGHVRPELNESLVGTVSDLSRGEAGVW